MTTLPAYARVRTHAQPCVEPRPAAELDRARRVSIFASEFSRRNSRGNMVNRHHSGFLLDNRHQKIIENAMLNCPVQTKGLPYFDFQGGSVYILRENF